MDARPDPPIALAELAEELRRRTQAICGVSGGLPPVFEEGVAAYRDYLRESGHLRSLADIELFETAFGGDEHDVWLEQPLAFGTGFDNSGERQAPGPLWGGAFVVKGTHPGFFGQRVVYRADEDPRCLPHEYFDRWALHIEIFGDDVEFLGAIETPAGLRTFVRQRMVKGTPATDDEIDRFFVDNGWRRFSWNGNIAYFDEPNELVVSDTHPGNLVRMSDGQLAPIDLRIQRVSGAIFDAVNAMAAAS